MCPGAYCNSTNAIFISIQSMMRRRLFSTAVQPTRVGDALLQQLGRVANRVTTNASIVHRHGDDESHHSAVPPEAVVHAHSTEEAAAVVKICAETKTPLVSFGTGTSLEGHIQAVHGGVCLDLSEMTAVLEVNAEDMDARVQAGVTRLSLNKHLRDTGLCFPIDPGADASIGGMVATGGESGVCTHPAHTHTYPTTRRVGAPCTCTRAANPNPIL